MNSNGSRCFISSSSFTGAGLLPYSSGVESARAFNIWGSITIQKPTNKAISRMAMQWCCNSEGILPEMDMADKTNAMRP